MNGGWKTVVISRHCALSFTENCLHAEGDLTLELPLEQIRILMIDSLQVTVSTYLLSELVQRGIKVVFCDGRHNPCAEIVGYRGHYLSGSKIRQQLAWDPEKKDLIWQGIVREKISMQKGLLEKLHVEVPTQMQAYLHSVEPGDRTNREGQAAKVYFHALFGSWFSRGSGEGGTNAILNYGYSLLLSSMNRLVTGAGFLTNFGINHTSETNPFNLSCDLMEPFRPYIDETAYLHSGAELSGEMKSILLDSIYREVIYRETRTQLFTAMEQYAYDVLGSLSGTKDAPGKLGFA